MKFRSASSAGAYVLYAILLLAWIIALRQKGEPMWYLGFAPWYGFGLIFLVRGTRYQIYKEKLLVKNPFERKQVPLHSIHQVEGIKNPLWKRCVLGVPSHSLKVAYQQQEELMLHPAKPKELQRLLQEKTSA